MVQIQEEQKMAGFSWAQWGIVECLYVHVLVEAVCLCVLKKMKPQSIPQLFFKMC